MDARASMCALCLCFRCRCWCCKYACVLLLTGPQLCTMYIGRWLCCTSAARRSERIMLIISSAKQQVSKHSTFSCGPAAAV